MEWNWAEAIHKISTNLLLQHLVTEIENCNQIKILKKNYIYLS